MTRWALAIATLAALPAFAQEAGWHYSPFDGEGDRAAMGCAYGADARSYTCLVVRCEDDMSVGLHIHTSRSGGDAGRWALDIDDVRHEIVAAAEGSPYHARIAGDGKPLIEAMKNGAVAYLDPLDGAAVTRSAISLSGSLHAINQALYYCVPAL